MAGDFRLTVPVLLDRIPNGSIPRHFLFPSAQLYSTDPKDFPGCIHVPGPSEEQMWNNAIVSMQKTRASLDAGKIAVPCFVEDDKQLSNVGMNIKPPCKWCSYQMFCRYA